AETPITEAKAKELSDADLKLAREQFKGIYDATRELRARWKADHEYADGVYPDVTTKRWTPQGKAAKSDPPIMHTDAIRPIMAQCELELGEGSYEANKSAFADSAGEMGAAASCWASEGRSITVASWYRVKVTKVMIRGTGADGQPVEREVPQRRVCLSTITAT